MSFCCRGSRIPMSSFLWCRFNKGHEEDGFPTLSTALSQIQKRSIDHLMAGLIPQHTCCRHHTPPTWRTADIWTFHQLLQDNLYSLAAAALMKELIRTLMIDTRLSPLMHSSTVFTCSECVPAVTHSQRRPRQEALGIICPSAEPGLRLFLHYCHMWIHWFFTSCLCSHFTEIQWDCTHGDLWRIYQILKVLNTVQWKLSQQDNPSCQLLHHLHLADITTEGWWKDELSDLKQPPGTTVSLQRENPLRGVHIRFFLFCFF